MIRIEFSDQIGGVSVYCGSKETPKGRVKGTSNQCYKNGLRNGFVAGIKKGSETSKVDNSGEYLTRKQFEEEFNNGEAILQRPLQAIARLLNIDRPADKKSLLLPRIRAKNWDRIKLIDIIKG